MNATLAHDAAQHLEDPFPELAEQWGEPLDVPPSTARSESAPVVIPPQGPPGNEAGLAAAELAAIAQPGVMRRNAWQPTLATFADPPPKRPWLFRHAVDSEGARVVPGAGAGVIGRGFVQNIAGHGGSGKGIALAQLALAAITGRAWCGLDRDPECSKGKVLLVVAEDDRDEYARRLHAAGQCLTLDERALVAERLWLITLQGQPGIKLAKGLGPVEATDAHRDLWAFLGANGDPSHGWAAVILDPYAQFAGPNAESDNGAATENMALIDQFTKAPGNPGVIVAHHTSIAANADKSPRTRGVGGADNSARSVLTWQRDAQKRAKLGFAKNNYAARIVESLDLVIGADGWWAPLGEAEREAEQATKAESDAATKAEQVAQRATIQAKGKGAAFEALVTEAREALVDAVGSNPGLRKVSDVKAQVRGGNTANGPKDVAWKRLTQDGVILKNSEGAFYVARPRVNPS